MCKEPKEKYLFEIRDREGNTVTMTRAVSEKQAINNARHRLVGDYYGHNYDFSAWLVTDEDGRAVS